MKLVSILSEGQRFAGVLEDDRVFVTSVPGLDVAIAAGINLKDQPGQWRKVSSVQFDVPLRPGYILCTGNNYTDHLDERLPAAHTVNAPARDLEFFIKAGQTIASLNEPLRLDASIGTKIDQETELGLVVGPACPRRVSEESALDYVFGYLVVNDISARDKQVRFMRDGSSFMVLGASKNFDGATRLSQYVVSTDEIDDVYNLDLRTYVNGELKQQNSTSRLVNSLSRIVAFFSQGLSLQPGGIISTGTPGGTGWGQDRELGGNGQIPPGCTPARYLRPGDEVRSAIGKVGELTFRVE